MYVQICVLLPEAKTEAKTASILPFGCSKKRGLQHPDVRGPGGIPRLHLLLRPLPRLAIHPELQLRGQDGRLVDSMAHVHPLRLHAGLHGLQGGMSMQSGWGVSLTAMNDG